MESVKDAETVSVGQDETKGEASPDASLAENIMIAAPTPTYIPSSPPPPPAGALSMDVESLSGEKSDSEAETVLLPGVDGYSPSKSRKVKLEDKNDDNNILEKIAENEEQDGETTLVKERDGSPAAPTSLGKRKRRKSNGGSRGHQRQSSGLSSVPTSPITTTRSSLSKPTESNSDVSRSPSPRPDKKSRPFGRQSPETRDAPFTPNDDKASRRKKSPSDANKHVRAHSIEINAQSDARSVSPPGRTSRRSVSTQPPALTSSSTKKKRVPLPIKPSKEQDKDSEESSAGDSPPPRRSRTRHLGTPPTGDSSTSLAAKMGKRKRVQYGSSSLAIACEHGELKKAKEMLEENPEDLDSPDNAGNTPLQVAALNGHANICKFLISKGCDVHCQNTMKESPLLDAAENGHLEVVRVLLAAGVNPRLRNLEGEEAVDRIDEDADDADAIRDIILKARTSWNPSSLANSKSNANLASNQDIGGYKNPTISHSRAQRTKTNQLYLSYDIPTLRSKAAIGDDDSVYKILEVLSTKAADPEALVNAAKGGHENVVNFMLALTGASPDPDPVRSKDRDYATPILAAIGGDNIKVVEVLLGGIEDGRFNPTKKHDGKSYPEIARERRGPNWQQEETLLEDAISKYESMNPKKSSSTALRRKDNTSKSGGRKDSHASEQSSESKTIHQRSNSGSSNGPKKEPGTSSMEPNLAKKTTIKPRPDRSASSDNESAMKQASQLHKTDADAGSAASDNERKPRRKLLSGKDFKKQGDRERTTSIASAKSGISVQDNEAESKAKKHEPTRSRVTSSSSVDAKALDKTLERARSSKRDESKDRLTAVRAESPNKRPRTSPSPSVDVERGRLTSTGENGKPNKRRRIEGDAGTTDRARSHSLSSAEHKASAVKDVDSGIRDESPEARRTNKRRLSTRSEDKPDSVREGSSGPKKTDSAETHPNKKLQTSSSRPSPEPEDEVKELRAKLAAERLAEELRQKQEAENQERLEQARIKRIEDERIAKELEAHRLREEAAQQEKDEVLRREREEAAEKARLDAEKLDAERRERELREEAERKAEEEAERKRQFEEQQRVRREEQERRKAEHEAFLLAEQQRLHQERENARLAKLPPLLRWLDTCESPARAELAEKVNVIYGVRHDTINPGVASNADAHDQWVLNTQVALLLGEKDLQLSRYTAWDRLPANDTAKLVLWNLLGDHYSLVSPDLRRTLLDSQSRLTSRETQDARNNTFQLWKQLDMFFIRVSELMFIVPKFPHLHNLELFVHYKELPVMSNADSTVLPPRWKSDPDANQFVAPGKKTYVNGQLVFERRPQDVYHEFEESHSPLPKATQKYPLLAGVRPIKPGHALFEQLCREQGLEYLLTNGEGSEAAVNGMTPPDSVNSIEDLRRSSGASDITTTVVNGVHDANEA